MSTLQAGLPFELKQEVNRRIAEHKNRKAAPAVAARPHSAAQWSATQRAAAAAARVAERFAHAPTYTETLVDDARTPGRVAEEPHTPVAVAPEPNFVEFQTAIQVEPVVETTHEEPIPIVHHAPETRADARLFGGAAGLGGAMAAEWDSRLVTEEVAFPEEAEPIPANLIQFPRELIATRKIRPRLVEGPLASSRDEQLSIFEVDPEAISTVAAPAAVEDAAGWNQPEWSGIKLDAQPDRYAEEFAEPAAAVEIELAPLSRRLLAVVVDAMFIVTGVLMLGALMAANSSALPGPRGLLIAGCGLFLAVAAAYEWFFFTLAQGTPGMRYACISLCTLRNEQPTRQQRLRRLKAMAVSVLPVGLGLLWALFDEERLSWHDRFSQTYLRLC